MALMIFRSPSAILPVYALCQRFMVKPLPFELFERDLSED